jgi:hypothetical protein
VLAESILKGNLTDLWSKYLSTLQPNRRASTDLKIVSILKERMRSLDSDDSDDMLEYFMDMEGVEAAAELMSARASAGLPQRRPSLPGTSSSSGSPAVASRRRTLVRSNEERTTQATTTTAAGKEEENKEKEKEKEKKNNDDEEKEEGNVDKDHQQRETRERIFG